MPNYGRVHAPESTRLHPRTCGCLIFLDRVVVTLSVLFLARWPAFQYIAIPAVTRHLILMGVHLAAAHSAWKVHLSGLKATLRCRAMKRASEYMWQQISDLFTPCSGQLYAGLSINAKFVGDDFNEADCGTWTFAAFASAQRGEARVIKTRNMVLYWRTLGLVKETVPQCLPLRMFFIRVWADSVTYCFLLRVCSQAHWCVDVCVCLCVCVCVHVCLGALIYVYNTKNYWK